MLAWYIHCWSQCSLLTNQQLSSHNKDDFRPHLMSLYKSHFITYRLNYLGTFLTSERSVIVSKIVLEPFLNNQVDIPQGNILYLRFSREKGDERRCKLFHQHGDKVWTLVHHLHQLHDDLQTQHTFTALPVNFRKKDAISVMQS